MATETVEIERKNGGELKYLGFVMIGAIQMMACVSNLYEFAKKNCGSLKSSVGSVEDVVSKIVGPVYQKFKGVPGHLLIFVDNKVDEATHKFEEHAPPLAKRVASQAHSTMQKATKKTQTLIYEAQVGGLGAAVLYASTESKNALFTQSLKTWTVLDQITLFHSVAEMAVPTAAYCSQKYNCFVTDLTGKGYTVFGYLPLVPIDWISKKVKQSKEGGKATTAPKSNDSSSDSDERRVFQNSE